MASCQDNLVSWYHKHCQTIADLAAARNDGRGSSDVRNIKKTCKAPVKSSPPTNHHHHHHHLRLAPLRVRSATGRQHPPEWSVLGQVDCVGPRQPVGVEVDLHHLHPGHQPDFLQAGCPSRRPTSSVKALKESYQAALRLNGKWPTNVMTIKRKTIIIFFTNLETTDLIEINYLLVVNFVKDANTRYLTVISIITYIRCNMQSHNL